ncbi:hypothetical protein [Variovorax boronicumulans]|uniref:hypothetical protein n=1 Tax=Variovorax boronicumulans TaxID=436515 RepID=UPI003395177B
MKFRLRREPLALGLVTVLTACGGGGNDGTGGTGAVPLASAAPMAALAASGDSAAKPTTVPVGTTALLPSAAPSTTLVASVPALTLSVNDTDLNAALTGRPRTLTITNTGLYEAAAVVYTVSPALPQGSTISPPDCGAIAAGGSCVLTVTPGSTPTAAPGNASPAPVVLGIQGRNTNALTAELRVLGYGGIYQGGLVFAIDDTGAPSGSVIAKVLATSSAAPSVPWGVNGPVPGAKATQDGRSNTQAIQQASGTASGYAARSCSESTEAGYRDWYLPALCEMTSFYACGTPDRPLMQNIKSSLSDPLILEAPWDAFWSSTVPSEGDGSTALAVGFQPFSQIRNEPRTSLAQARCVRATAP